MLSVLLENPDCLLQAHLRHSSLAALLIQGDKRRSNDLPSRPSAAPEAPKRQAINLPQLQQRLSQLVGRNLSNADMSKITGLPNYQQLAVSGSDLLLPGEGSGWLSGAGSRGLSSAHHAVATWHAAHLETCSIREYSGLHKLMAAQGICSEIQCPWHKLNELCQTLRLLR